MIGIRQSPSLVELYLINWFASFIPFPKALLDFLLFSKSTNCVLPILLRRDSVLSVIATLYNSSRIIHERQFNATQPLMKQQENKK